MSQTDRDQVITAWMESLFRDGVPPDFLEVDEALTAVFDAGLAEGKRAGAEEERAAAVSFIQCAIDCDSEECESCPIYKDMAECVRDLCHLPTPPKGAL